MIELPLNLDFESDKEAVKFQNMVDQINHKVTMVIFLILFATFFLFSFIDLLGGGGHLDETAHVVWSRLLFGLLLLAGSSSLYSYVQPNKAWAIHIGVVLAGGLVTSWQYAQIESVLSLWFHFGYLLLGFSITLITKLKIRVWYLLILLMVWIGPYFIHRPAEFSLNFSAFLSFLIASILVLLMGHSVFMLLRGMSIQTSYIKESLSRYVSKDVTEVILSQDHLPSLEGEERDVTVLFSDLKGYSTIIEELPPQKVLSVLNEYLSAMQIVIDRYHGCVIEFLGDGILVVFNAPDDIGNHQEMAALCAIDMVKSLRQLNKDWKDRRHEPEGRSADALLWLDGTGELQCRIGIHSGVVVAGNMGSLQRMKYGVVGDVVNVAARLEALNKTLGTQVLLSDDTYHAMESLTRRGFHLQGSYSLKGRDKQVDAFAWKDL